MKWISVRERNPTKLLESYYCKVYSSYFKQTFKRLVLITNDGQWQDNVTEWLDEDESEQEVEINWDELRNKLLHELLHSIDYESGVDQMIGILQTEYAEQFKHSVPVPVESVQDENDKVWDRVIEDVYNELPPKTNNESSGEDVKEMCICEYGQPADLDCPIHGLDGSKDVEDAAGDLELINGLIPFKLTGDLDSFEKKYMPFFNKHCSIEDSRNIVSSIWLFVNDQWRNGAEYGARNGFKDITKI